MLKRKIAQALSPTVFELVIVMQQAKEEAAEKAATPWITGARLLTAAFANKDVIARHDAMDRIDKDDLRKVLDGAQRFSLKVMAAKALYLQQGRDTGFVTWDEQLPFLQTIVLEYRTREMIFDQQEFIALLEKLEPYEIEYALRLLPTQEVAATIVENTKNLRSAGPALRDAFGDDVTAEAAFASTLLPHDPAIYAEIFCETFDDHLALANRVAAQWEPHPIYDWLTCDSVVQSSFAGYLLKEEFITGAIGKDNHPAVDAYLTRQRDTIRLSYGGVKDISMIAAEEAPIDVAGELFWATDTAEGQYLKVLFDFIRAEYVTSRFTYDDLPLAPLKGNRAPITALEPSAEIVTVGSAAEMAMSPF